jgi:hypothetical protein
LKASIYAAAALFLFAALVAAGSTISTPRSASAEPMEKVTICHLTHSATNPAVEIDVSGNATLEARHLRHGDFIIDEDNPFCPALEEADLIIEKVCEPDDPEAGPFTIEVLDDGGDVVETAELMCGEESEPIPLEIGVEYTVVEEPVDGFAATYTGLCDGDGTLTFDGTAAEGTCVVTNTGGLTTVGLTIAKECDPTRADLFNIRVLDAAMAVVGFANLNCGASSAPPIMLAAPGIYTVVETPVPGVDVAYTGDCDGDGSLEVDGTDPTLTCTVTNTPSTTPPG